jgi:predicted nucleotidyltransferase
MKTAHPDPASAPLPRWYRGANIPRRLIRRFAREVAERFHPEKIILFGSYAYGQPHADSDVDVLVIMPARNEMDLAVKICLAVEYNFPLDLLVRTPKNLARRLAEGDSFLREIMDRGTVLYEKAKVGSIWIRAAHAAERSKWPHETNRLLRSAACAARTGPST